MRRPLLALLLAIVLLAPVAALAGAGQNDAGTVNGFDCDTSTGVVTPSYSLYWHLGASRSDSPAKSADEIRPLAMAAVYGTDAGLDAEGLALLGSWWTDQVIARSPTTLPTGQVISQRAAMRKALQALAKILPPPG